MHPCMPLTRIFHITLRSERRDFFPSGGGNGEFCWGEFNLHGVGTWGEVILTIQTFFKAKNNIL